MSQSAAAKRIVTIQNDLARRMPPETRRQLAAEQGSLWDQFFPSATFERITEALRP